MPLPRAVLFDLDGTLVDTSPDLMALVNAFLVEHDRPALPPERLRAFTGDGARVLLAEGFAATGAPLTEEALTGLSRDFLRRYTAQPCVHSRVYPGLVAALQRLHAAGVGLGVCTNKPQRPSELLLDALDLKRFFSTIVGGDALPVRKPDPGHVLAVLRALGVAAQEAVMIGDSANDIDAARAAGVVAIGVRFGFALDGVPAPGLAADHLIDHFGELLPLLERLNTARRAS